VKFVAHELEPLALIVNPEAAAGKWQRRLRAKQQIEELFGEKIKIASGTKQSTVNLVREIAPQLKTVIAVGGDGTIADVLEGLVKAGRLNDVLFGIIPFGSGNAFRLAFDIPKSFKKALKVIKAGKVRLVDLVHFEDKVAGFISVGATAAVTEAKIQHQLPGFWGHVWAGRQLLSLEPQPWEVELESAVDNQGQSFSCLRLELKVLDAVITKTNYFGYKWHIAPLARTDDGFLDITFFEMSGPQYVLSLPSIYFGRKQLRLRHFKARRLTLRGEKLPIQYNGEFFGWRQQITFEVWPKVLKLICPQPKRSEIKPDEIKPDEMKCDVM